jgi:hypothetical protein
MKFKNNTVTIPLIAILLIGLVAGCQNGKTDESDHQGVEIGGIYISGKNTKISADDVAEISKIIQEIENADPILSIHVLSKSHVEVETGVIRGPLDGGGRIYDLKKKNKKWEIYDTGYIKSWVS